MSRNVEIVKDAVLRVFVIAGVAVAFGYLIFGSAVFDIRMAWFEFVANGVTISIAYMTFKLDHVRNGFVILLFWYLFLIAFVYVPHNNWMPIQAASYVAGLTAAIYGFSIFARKHIINGWVQRFLSVVLLIGFAHALIVLFLYAVTLRAFTDPLWSLRWSFVNLKNGVIIGILCGAGIELSERIIRSKIIRDGAWR